MCYKKLILNTFHDLEPKFHSKPALGKSQKQMYAFYINII